MEPWYDRTNSYDGDTKIVEAATEVEITHNVSWELHDILCFDVVTKILICAWIIPW